MKRTAVALILAVALAPAWGQGPIQPPPANQPAPNQPDPNQGDAPNHGVARLSFVQGNVGMRHGDLGELTPAGVNVPLVTTDRVETGDTGRAEVQFDFNNMIRLAPSTEVRLSELEFQHFQVQIAAGTASFQVLQDPAQSGAQAEISTPQVSVRPLKAGTYRVTVRPDGITEITVRSGQAEIDGPNGNENLVPGQTMQIRPGANGPEFQLVAAIPMDDFDRFNQDRDKVMQQASQSGSYRPGYLPPSVAGGEALDQYGQWQNDPNYGNVWVPNEPPGWAPYQDGSWVDENYYGWTWLGAEPWGWAPYHYGSWYMGPWGGWAWWPGAFGGPHFWRPAMVGFFGWGSGVGIGVGFGFGFGHVGWVPLAPYEAFHPWYGAGAVAGRFGGSNVAAVNAFRNARVGNAVSSMNAADFGHASVAGASMVRPSSAELARSSAIRGGLGLAPSAASRRITTGAVNTRGMPQTGSTARFYSRSSSSAANGNGNAGWRGFNGYNAAGGARGNVASGQGRQGAVGQQGSGARGGSPQSVNRGASPQSGYGGQSRGGNYAQPQSRPAPQQQPLRMNPSIVQPRAPSGGGMRSAPAPSRGGGGGHGGGGRR